MELPIGYEAIVAPRSSTYKNFGVIQTNHLGIIDGFDIDESGNPIQGTGYCGDDDEWRAVFYATRPGVLRVGERIVQMTIEKTSKFNLVEVEHLGNENRGGYGSTN